MPNASLTNMNMVRPKGPKIFLGVLAVAAIGSAAWWFMQPKGAIGEPEQPYKILIVGGDETTAKGLTQVGFEVRQNDFETLAKEGSAGGEGAAAILHLADEHGYGYVAIEDPVAHKVALTVSGDSADVGADHRWAVFSVGDLGMPPKVTVDPEPSALPLPDYVEILRAAFKQDRLGSTLFAESQLPMDAVELHARIKTSIDLHGGYAMLDREINKGVRKREEALIEEETVDSAPIILAGALEETTVVPLADGSILSLSRGNQLESAWDAEVSLRPKNTIELFAHLPGTPAMDSRVPCDSLRGGTLPRGRNSYQLSADGRVLLLEGSGYLELWAVDPAKKSCAFSKQGQVPLPRDNETEWGDLNGAGQIARAASGITELAINVWTPGKDDPQIIPLPGCSTVSEPVWLDDQHLVTSCRYDAPVPDQFADYEDDDYEDDDYDDFDDEDGDDAEETEEAEPAPPVIEDQTWLYIVRVSDQRILAIPGTSISEDESILRLRAVPGSETLDLLGRGPYGGTLLRIRAPLEVSAMYTAREQDFVTLAARLDQPKPEPVLVLPPAEGEVAEEPTERTPPPITPDFVPWAAPVAVADPPLLEVTTVSHNANLSTMSLSPDGKRMVYVTRDGYGVEVAPLDGGTPITVSRTENAGADQPRFTADGTAVVFVSEVGDYDTEQVGRYAVIPSP